MFAKSVNILLPQNMKYFIWGSKILCNKLKKKTQNHDHFRVYCTISKFTNKNLFLNLEKIQERKM